MKIYWISCLMALLSFFSVQASEIFLLKGHKVDSPKITPRFGIELPVVRLLNRVVENNNGQIKVDFYVQNNVILGKCTPTEKGPWNCPVTSNLHKIENLELRNNIQVFLEDTYIDMLAIEFGNDGVMLAKGFEIHPWPVSSGFILRKKADTRTDAVTNFRSLHDENKELNVN